jgi:hypothetical protein
MCIPIIAPPILSLMITQMANIALTGERFFAVVMPLQFRKWNHRRHVIISACVIFGIGVFGVSLAFAVNIDYIHYE